MCSVCVVCLLCALRSARSSEVSSPVTRFSERFPDLNRYIHHGGEAEVLLLVQTACGYSGGTTREISGEICTTLVAEIIGNASCADWYPAFSLVAPRSFQETEDATP